MASDKFTLKKEISIPHIMTFITMVGGLCLWYAGLESRIAVVETKIVSLRQADERSENYLIRIEKKLDNLISRRRQINQ